MTEKLVRSVKKEVAGATNARKRTFLFKCPRWSNQDGNIVLLRQLRETRRCRIIFLVDISVALTCWAYLFKDVNNEQPGVRRDLYPVADVLLKASSKAWCIIEGKAQLILCRLW